MGRFWSILFLLVPLLGAGSIIWAIAGYPPMEDHWLPKDVSEGGAGIDHLFNIILYLTGAIFIGTGLVLALLLWRYGEHRCDKEVECTHGSHKMEATWSIIPGLILVFLSFYQIKVWDDHKLNQPTEVINNVEQPKSPMARVLARQFGWQFQYAGKDQLLDTHDDFITETTFVIPKNEDIVVTIESEDVLHSFFLPNLRVKQDIVPGMVQHTWFKATETGNYDIACAELCGWGHYKMRGRLTVLEPEDYQAWFEEEYERQHATNVEVDSD